MAIALTGEQRDLQRAVSDFAAKEAGTRAQRDALTDSGRRHHSPEIDSKMADLGWSGIIVPEEYGGSGGSMTDMCIVLEGITRGMVPSGGTGPTLIVAGAYARYADEQQKKTVLGGIARGEHMAISMSEPGSGSDVASLQCRAERVEGGWRVNGQKTWCSNAHFATHVLLAARTSKGERKHDGITMFQVPTDAAGLEIRGISTLGGEEVNDLFFTDCLLPDDAVVGEVGQGWQQLIAGLNVERLILAALSLGQAQRTFDDCLAFVRQREQFGRPVGTFQVLRHRIADLATELECTRLLVYAVAAQVDAAPGELFPREASMAKLKATEVAKRMAVEGMQMMGGYGYATEFDMEQHLRTSIVSTVYGGTNEIQRDIIGKTFGL